MASKKVFTNVHEALASRIPETKDWIKRVWIGRFEEAFKRFGPKLPYRTDVSQRDYKLLQEARGNAKVETRDSVGNALTFVIDMERVEKRALAHAEALCLQWEKKITEKVERLTNVQLVYGGDLTYTITGERDGEKVLIEQIMTLCSNSHGTVYNQFPARIYMDGKFVPEEEYKARFGEVKAARPVAGYKVRETGRWTNDYRVYPVAADGKKTEGEVFYIHGGKEAYTKARDLNAKLGYTK